MRLLLALLTIGSVLVNVVSAEAAPTAQEIVTQARAKLGVENKLNAVKSLTFEGKSYTVDGKEIAVVQLQYKAPGKRREYGLINGGNIETIKGTDGLEAFEKAVNLSTKEQQVRALGNAEVAVFTDYYYIDMGFFAAPPRGKLTYVGEGKQQGKDCYILDYQYAGGLVLRRYFDKSTSLLIAHEMWSSKTDGSNKVLVVEEGEIVEAGIRFPKRTVIYEQDKDTKEYKRAGYVDYSKIVVNDNIPDSAFAFPMP
ncbi:MAG: hypothetical protein LBV12_09100 [Puniceicoccales bacterium]|jgi:outer membrane lipoprotein-sorting protein|nr:hypothetical protein [Puniceicoccales bacterium]